MAKDKYAKKFPRLRRPDEGPKSPQVHIAEYTPAEERMMQRAIQQSIEFMESFGQGAKPITNGYGFFRGRKYID